MKRSKTWLLGAALLVGGGCMRSPPPPPPAPPPPLAPPAPPPPPQVVWTARPEVGVRQDGEAIALPRPFTRLDVLERDSVGLLRVSCAYCEKAVGGRVAERDVIWDGVAPETAAGGNLAEFALAVREAAAWRRVESLAPVMVEDFTFGFSAQRDRGIALIAWAREDFRELDQVPRLLDAGLVEIEKDFWVAPAEYAERPGYGGLRLGFRRNESTGKWEWLFLVRGGP